jgi:hypothetical protein
VSIKTRKIYSSLKSKGFEPTEGDHTFYWFFLEGLKTHIKTKISHGTNEYGGHLLSVMRKQLKLKSALELKDLINCPMSQERYIELLKERDES